MLDISLSPALVTTLMFGCLVVGILSGYILGFMMLGVGFVFGLLFIGSPIFGIVTAQTYKLMTNYILLAVPMFVFMGSMLGHSGLADRLFETLHLIMGGLRGGLALATLVVATVFAACTGIIGASVVTMGIMALAPMLNRGYDRSLACGVVCAGGTLGILIPPSIMLVIYGPMAEISVGKLFAGALIPGVVLSGLYMLYVGTRCALNPNLGPPLSAEERGAHGISVSRKVYLVAFHLLPPLFIILAVLGTILGGVATPTEAAAMGALAATLLTAANKQLNRHVLKKVLRSTLKVVAFIALLTIGAKTFTSVFLYLGGGEFVTQAVTSVPGGKWASFACMIVIVVLLGMFIEWVGSIFFVVPLFTPVGAALGFDPVWFAICICLAYQTGFLSPPNAHAIFYLKSVAPPEVSLGDIIRGVLPFIGLIIIGLLLCILFPELILWLPRVAVG